MNTKSGQALLLILLTMAAIVTVVLSIVSRSVTDVSISTRESESQRAFSAAEAGVEKALVYGTGGTQAIGDATFNAAVTNFGQGMNSYVYPLEVPNGDAATVWFVSHDVNNDDALTCTGLPCFTGSSMKVCWGKPGTSDSAPTTPAIQISVFYAATPGDFSTLRVARGTFDANAGRRGVNFFFAPDSGTCTINGQGFRFQKTISLNNALPSGLGIPSLVTSTANGLQFGRIRFYYNNVSQPFGVTVSGLLPSQGRKIDSYGQSGQSSRRVEVYSLFSDLPPVFDSAIFTYGGISK